LILFLALLQAEPLGFYQSSRQAYLAHEARMLQTPAPQAIREKLRKLTEEPHVAGTANDRAVVDYIKSQLDKAGFKTEIAQYEVLLNYPKKVEARLVEPENLPISLRETGSIRDKDAFSADVFPAFHGYGASGRAAGQVVYVNYCSRDDFDRAEKLGVSIKGRIVLCRYGQVFRGLKVREAQQRAAAGVFIFSDPADDGWAKGDIYPDGPMRPEGALQRGSVEFLSEATGDPTTPGWASKKGAKRVPNDKAVAAKIPSLPISYGEAQKILRALAGPRVPDEWQGGLPFAYHVGPGPAKIEMSVEMDYAIRPIWNVIATLPGSGPEAGEKIIFGGHHDAWTYGAVDPNSGTSVLLELARSLGEAKKNGWQPRRTIVIASWDGEEYGLVGSTEWVEDHAAELAKDAVAYFNFDAVVTGGEFGAAGVPALRDAIIEATRAVPEPRRGKMVYDAWSKKQRGDWANQPFAEEPFEISLGALGSGSDFTAFLDHVGVPAADVRFSGPYGVYHSILDNIYWMEKFGDPEFVYHQALTRIAGVLAMRMSSAEVLPLRFRPYARAMNKYVEDLGRHAAKVRRQFDPADPPKKGPPIAIDTAAVAKAIADASQAAADLDAALDAAAASGRKSPTELARLNSSLMAIERTLIEPGGVVGRPWFRHTVYAPGVTTGYAAWPFPELAQAVEDRDAALWQRGSSRIVARLSALTNSLRAATQLAR
jgi:N-acetylated-alpha-linked acidic dipeptidase